MEYEDHDPRYSHQSIPDIKDVIEIVINHLTNNHPAGANYGTLTQETIDQVKKEGTFSTNDFRIKLDHGFKAELIKAGIPEAALENLNLG
jgi:hypothetical protein